MSEHSPVTPDTSITYAVWYQTANQRSPEDWFEMQGRDWNERYRNPSDHSLTDETTSMDEAVEIAEALVNRRSYPQDPKSHHYDRVTRSRVLIRVYTGHVAAEYSAQD